MESARGSLRLENLRTSLRPGNCAPWLGGRNHGEEDASGACDLRRLSWWGLGVPEGPWALGLGVRRGRRK